MIQPFAGFRPMEITGASSLRTPSPVPATGEQAEKDAKLRNAAGQLEGLFVQQLFKSMRETVPQGEGIVSGGTGEDIFTGLLDQHVAADTPKQWERGMAEALYRQLRGSASATSSTQVEVAPTPSTSEADNSVSNVATINSSTSI